MKAVAWILALAAVNWGLVGLLRVNLVEAVLGGPDSLLVKVVYVLIGLAGLYKLYILALAKK